MNKARLHFTTRRGQSRGVNLLGKINCPKIIFSQTSIFDLKRRDYVLNSCAGLLWKVNCMKVYYFLVNRDFRKCRSSLRAPWATSVFYLVPRRCILRRLPWELCFYWGIYRAAFKSITVRAATAPFAVKTFRCPFIACLKLMSRPHGEGFSTLWERLSDFIT